MDQVQSHVQDDPQSSGDWVKSSLSFANGNCVEVTGLGGGSVGVRDSNNPQAPPLVFTRDEWAAFIGGAKNGEFDAFGR